ncbi:MAG: hypothetical protein IIC75_07095 [Bacteroidetes bacterium]|nr:hypothetical protein [Bacteroidota bacterium]
MSQIEFEIKGIGNLIKEKEWKKSDQLRDKIHKLGYSIDDTKEGTVVKKGVI